MNPSKLRFAMIGECMLEPHYDGASHIVQSFGDTLNTAAYARRLCDGLGNFVEYISAIGDAPFRADMADFWAIKDGANPCTFVYVGNTISVPAEQVENVNDTTAAEDSFSAAYMLGRALGLGTRESALRAHAVAGAVVQHHGAIIPKEATPRVFAAELVAAE